MTVIVVPSVLIWILVALAALNLGATLYKLHLMKRVQKENPLLHDGIVLPEDCTPRRFGDHRMDDRILCVKNSKPGEYDKTPSAGAGRID